ncbi:nuclease-related domain-containing protein [uncultured Shewanella sp.]|uniref:nuclease-related domain-containing protein n=1 Tax=uncultured Shewanella sp. TaxID=173975 RepID=UPI00262237B2|nr:nuclease-related domain-containing protein [uncultured Shewanella sp.]
MSELTTNLLSIVILLSGMGVVLLVMFVMLKHRDRTVRLPIDREQLTRIPALGLQNQIQDLQFDVLSALLMAVMAVCFPFAYFGLKAFLTIGSIHWLLVAFILVGLIYSGYRTWKTMSQLAKVRLGHTAELATASELIGLQALGYQVFHDVQADGFNIDHLVVGQNGVFAIETKGRHKRTKDKKNGGKDYQLFFKDNRLTFPSWTETKPLEQATRQGKWVGEWLTKSVGLPINPLPVLVFPGWFVTSQSKPPFPIMNHKQLVKAIPTLRSQAFTHEQVNAIVYQVAQKCLNDNV